jgi:hypothetical protein
MEQIPSEEFISSVEDGEELKIKFVHEHKYSCCLVWKSIPFLSIFLPFHGIIGVVDSDGNYYLYNKSK